LGLPFDSSIDMFSLGLILAELLLSQPEQPSPSVQYRELSFPSSPPQSNSPQPVSSVPLVQVATSNRLSYIEQIIRLFGPLPQTFRKGLYWTDDILAPAPKLLVERLEIEGVDAELIDFIMRMLNLNPTKRISAKDALRHEWLVGPLLGYWAALGIQWTEADVSQRRVIEDPLKTERTEEILVESVKRRSSALDVNSSPFLPQKEPPLLDFASLPDDEDENDNDELPIVQTVSSSTKPLPYINAVLPTFDVDELV
jgi:serine/threonine protein kinase